MLPQEPGIVRVLMEGTFLINGRIAQALFDFGAYSFIVQECITALSLTPEVLRKPH